MRGFRSGLVGVAVLSAVAASSITRAAPPAKGTPGGAPGAAVRTPAPGKSGSAGGGSSGAVGGAQEGKGGTAATGAEKSALIAAYRDLANKSDHNHHRALALRHVRAACKIVGVSPSDEVAGTSTEYNDARAKLQSVLSSANLGKQQALASQANAALKEISLALSAK